MKCWLLCIVWLLSLLGLLGSYYFSEIKHIPPCAFCWYQRGVMFSLVIILGIAIFRKDYLIYRYAFPLAAVGWLICLWQILQNGFNLPGLCQTGCLPKETLEYYIPWASFGTFFLICLGLYLLRKQMIKKGLSK